MTALLKFVLGIIKNINIQNAYQYRIKRDDAGSLRFKKLLWKWNCEPSVATMLNSITKAGNQKVLNNFFIEAIYLPVCLFLHKLI
jgi:hypothetical protein